MPSKHRQRRGATNGQLADFMARQQERQLLDRGVFWSIPWIVLGTVTLTLLAVWIFG